MSEKIGLYVPSGNIHFGEPFDETAGITFGTSWGDTCFAQVFQSAVNFKAQNIHFYMISQYSGFYLVDLTTRRVIGRYVIETGSGFPREAVMDNTNGHGDIIFYQEHWYAIIMYGEIGGSDRYYDNTARARIRDQGFYRLWASNPIAQPTRWFNITNQLAGNRIIWWGNGNLFTPDGSEIQTDFGEIPFNWKADELYTTAGIGDTTGGYNPPSGGANIIPPNNVYTPTWQNPSKSISLLIFTGLLALTTTILAGYAIGKSKESKKSKKRYQREKI